MTLNDILHSAQGGQAVANLGAQYGLSAVDAEKAVQAMISAFSAALQQIVSNPAAIAGILKELASGDYAASYAPGQAPAPGAPGAMRSGGFSARRRRSRRLFSTSRRFRASVPISFAPCCPPWRRY